MTSLSGFFIGRFQPFHMGHLHALKYILKHVDEVILGIGSAQYSHTLENPFTAGERYVMIKRALMGSKIPREKCHIIPIDDVNVHNVWVCHVRSRVPNFKSVFSNDPLTSRLFKETGYKVANIPFFKRQVYSATEIRRRMMKKKNWQVLVPKAVADYLIEIDAVKRVKELTLDDISPR